MNEFILMSLFSGRQRSRGNLFFPLHLDLEAVIFFDCIRLRGVLTLIRRRPVTGGCNFKVPASLILPESLEHREIRERLFFKDYKVTGIFISGNKYLGPAARSSQPVRPTRAAVGSFQTVRSIESVKQFDNVRFKDMSKLDLSGKAELIATLRFNQKTVWPEQAKMPPGIDLNKSLTAAMNPGLGVRELHRQGITGKGVNVAIIDQAMYLDHPEFAGKIVAYHDLANGEQSSMHGPAVTSLLVGENCGTAPAAKVYYCATRSGCHEVDNAKALLWIIEQNKKLPTSEKIRVVSVSAAPGKAGTPSSGNQEKWNDACARAEVAGILVLDCTSYRGFIGPCWYDARDPENVAKCTSGFPGRGKWKRPGNILAPSSPRTTAEEYNKGEFSYQYCGRGGLSWSIPYCAGVLAMGWQINPELSPEQMRELLFKSAFMKKNGAKIIYPKKFIELVRKTRITPNAGRRSR